MFKPSEKHAPLRALAAPIAAVVATVLISLFALTDLSARLGISDSSSAESTDEHDEEHDAAQADHHGDELELSAQARTNMKLRVAPVSVGTFTDYIEVPALVTEWPGRTHIACTSPLTGVINAIYVSRGQLIESGAPIFALRLTHQDLVNAQKSFLSLLGELDVEEREVARLTEIARSGAVAGKTLINREYERDKRLAELRAIRQALLLHGLSEDQIKRIEQKRELIREMIVRAPSLHADRSIHHDALPHSAADAGAGGTAGGDQEFPDEHIDTDLLVSDMRVHPGESVETGQRLATLSDYSQLMIEGLAYQRDSDTLRGAADRHLPLQAVMESSSSRPLIIDDLMIAYIGNEVSRQSRALPFYVTLSNELEQGESGTRQYVSWKFKPGQRLRLRVPVTSIEGAIVVPKQAVAEEGPDRYVFVENGDHFERVSVSVIARNSTDVAIANDGQIWPGQSIAINRAHQLQMALKNQSGGAIDPHAGHSH
jgi:cobalt-zinc-cadmium efflux system membrane fusion protein